MASPFHVTVGQILKEFSLEVVYMPENGEDIQVNMTDIIRPGLPLAGFFEHFDNSRVQLLGMVEYSYLAGFTSEKRAESFDKYFATKFPLAIVTRNLDVYPEAIEAAKKYGVEFCYYDFAPRFREGQQKAREAELYMQKYCGCIYSEEDRYQKQIQKDLEKFSAR